MDSVTKQNYLKCKDCGVVKFGTVCGCSGKQITDMEIVNPPFDKTILDELDMTKRLKSDLDKKEKKLVAQVKEFLVAEGITDFNYEGHQMTIGYQDRGFMNEEKLISVLEEKFDQEVLNKYEAIKVTKVTSPDGIKNMLSEGLITVEELLPCKVKNLIPVFHLNAKVKKETKEFGGLF